VTRMTVLSPGKSKEREDALSVHVSVKSFGLMYGNTRILSDVSFDIYRNTVTAIIGPSGCGKTSLLRSLNRMNDMNASVRYEGDILFDGSSIFAPTVGVTLLRTRIGMVFQKPNVFPGSILENVTFGPRLFGIRDREALYALAEQCLQQAALWNEVKHVLHKPALSLSGGQQQRLCIARALALKPEVLLLDEPTSALDPISTLRIEELLVTLKEQCTIVIVTHNMQQAARIADYTAFLYAEEGEPARLVEYGKSARIFLNPENSLTEQYVTGRLG